MITITEATRRALNNIEPGTEFHGRDLYKEVIRNMRMGGNMGKPYVDTVLRMARNRRISGIREIVCVDHHKSRYKKLSHRETLTLALNKATKA